ncbi:hypothetical protein ONZ45_g6562 [Pleurotus djamor]|nr:hypothetical protein ONZ45_g6562 [Pleurotus djamor]
MLVASSSIQSAFRVLIISLIVCADLDLVREAKVELGEAIAAKLKLTEDGTVVLWPQPTDDPNDPQNWTNRRKALQLFIITLAAIVPDFDSGIGITSIFALAEQYDTTTGVINNLTSKSLEYLPARLGRYLCRYADEALWATPHIVLVTRFLVGATFSPTLKTFTAFRCLSGFFATAPQVTGLYIVNDMYPFHKQARMLNIWTMGFIISPFLSPFAFGFLVARASWRWAYGIGCMYGAVVVGMIVLFGEETMFDRTVKPIPQRPTTGMRYKIETLIGITGFKMAKYRSSLTASFLAPFNVVWRPHLLAILLFEAMLFGFSIGINVTNAVFLGTPPPVGFGVSQFAIAGAYGTPIVAVIIGEITGHFVNDWIMRWSIRRNNGVFEVESRLWAIYPAIPLYICGFVTLGAAVQNHLSIGAVIMGWGIAELAVMIGTVAVYAYCNDCFPKNQGEISGLINLARTLGGFSVAYFQVPWATKHGALQTFGVEAALVHLDRSVPPVEGTIFTFKFRGTAPSNCERSLKGFYPLPPLLVLASKMSMEEKHDEKRASEASDSVHSSEIDLLSYHEVNAGRLIIDPEEAKIELGESIAAKLKLTPDGSVVLWPQPTDDPEDPQNWSDRRKALQLLIVTLAAIVPDFDSGIGIAAIFALAEQYDTTTEVINNLTSNWSIFLLGWGGIFAVMLMRRYGRLPILFWSQLIAVGFLVGATFAPTLKTFTGHFINRSCVYISSHLLSDLAFRCLTAFFATAPQVTLNIWTMGFIISPFLSPFAFGFLVARASWRWAYGIGCIYGAVVVAMIVFFGEETLYDRTVKPIPQRPSSGMRYKIETLIGITGMKMAKYRSSWKESFIAPFNVVWRPHLLAILFFEALLFGFGIGINVTNAVFLGTPPPVGFGVSPFAIAGAYGTPIVAVLIGELTGHYVNDWIMKWSIRRNNGVFEAESRLWAVYLAIPLYICGFVTLGAAIQEHLSIGAVIMGWGIAELSIMIATVAVYAYCNDCFPKHQGEISGLINLARTLGGKSPCRS